MGRREARERDFFPFLFPSPPAPAASVTRRRLGTSQGSSCTTKARHLHLKILILDFLLAHSQNCQETCRPVKCDKIWCSKLIVLNLQSILTRKLSLGSRLDYQPRPLKYQVIKCAEIVEVINIILLIRLFFTGYYNIFVIHFKLANYK